LIPANVAVEYEILPTDDDITSSDSKSEQNYDENIMSGSDNGDD